ncbi:MAG: epimerase [Bacillota bacterium]
MNENALDYFGRLIMSEVRDETITSWDMIINGKMKGLTAQQVREKISGFSEEQIEVLKWLIPKVTDSCLYNLLTVIEQNDELKVTISDGQTDTDIKQISDGLGGELFTEDGWITRFSKERYDEI